MVNGKVTNLSRDDYARLQAQTEAIKLQRKAAIKALIGSFKEHSKYEPQAGE